MLTSNSSGRDNHVLRLVLSVTKKPAKKPIPFCVKLMSHVHYNDILHVQDYHRNFEKKPPVLLLLRFVSTCAKGSLHSSCNLISFFVFLRFLFLIELTRARRRFAFSLLGFSDECFSSLSLGRCQDLDWLLLLPDKFGDSLLLATLCLLWFGLNSFPAYPSEVLFGSIKTVFGRFTLWGSVPFFGELAILLRYF